MYKKTVSGAQGRAYEKTIWDSFEEIAALLDDRYGLHDAKVIKIENRPDKTAMVALEFDDTVYELDLFDVTDFFINMDPFVHYTSEVYLEKTEEGVEVVVEGVCGPIKAARVELSTLALAGS